MEQQPNYLRGINDGFRLRTYMPELYQLLEPSLNTDDDYLRGILDGAKQAEQSKEKNRNGDLEKIREPKTPDREKER